MFGKKDLTELQHLNGLIKGGCMILMLIAFMGGVLVGMSAMGLLIIKKLGGDKIDDEGKGVYGGRK